MTKTPQFVSIAAPLPTAEPQVEFLSIPTPPARHLFGLNSAALASLMTDLGEPTFRARQLAEGLYRQRLTSLDQFTTLPLGLRSRLVEAGWSVGQPTIAQTFTSADQTERYLIELPSESGTLASQTPASQTVETVWMPEGDDGESGEDDATDDSDPEETLAPTRKSKRSTICVSSQVGCAVNCQFCLTARLGLKRNLTAGEIAGQIVTLLTRHQLSLTSTRLNLVFMGMGEPFLNYPNFSAALRLLVEEIGLSPRRMTVSTSGILPGIEAFAKEPLHIRPRLAISLNAPNNSIRDSLMPINRKWPIDSLITALRQIPLRPRERITFEYVLLGGITDQPEHATQLARLIRRANLPLKVNLIAWNTGPTIPFTTPSPAYVESFRQSLIAQGIPTFLRKPRGLDIYAACGQLKRTVENSSAPQVI